MRWIFLALAACGFAVLWGVAPGYGLFAAFLVLFANFATFCVLYNRPMDRARQRVTEALRRLHRHSEMAQRLATARIAPSVADRRLGLGPLPVLNLVTGIAGAGFLVWGLVLRFM